MVARTSAVMLAAGLALGVAGCHREATDNPNAPGRPGAGNPTATVTPAAPDTAPGGGTAAAQPGQGQQGGMGAGAPTALAAGSAASSSAPSGQELPGGGPGTTYHSPGKN